MLTEIGLLLFHDSGTKSASKLRTVWQLQHDLYNLITTSEGHQSTRNKEISLFQETEGSSKAQVNTLGRLFTRLGICALFMPKAVLL